MPDRTCRLCGRPVIFGHTLEEWRAHRAEWSRQHFSPRLVEIGRKRKAYRQRTVHVQLDTQFGLKGPMLFWTQAQVNGRLGNSKGGKTGTTHYRWNSETGRAAVLKYHASRKYKRLVQLQRRQPLDRKVIREAYSRATTGLVYLSSGWYDLESHRQVNERDALRRLGYLPWDRRKKGVPVRILQVRQPRNRRMS